MKNIFTLALFCLLTTMSYAQSDLTKQDKRTIQALINGLKSVDSDKLAQLIRYNFNNTKTTNDDGKKVKEFEVTDESGQKYRVRLYSDLVTATLSKFNPSGKVVRIWDLKGRSGANASTAG